MKRAKEITKTIDNTQKDDKSWRIISHPLVTDKDIEEWASAEPLANEVSYDFSDVLKADNPRLLNEASLGRVYTHTQAQKGSWSILTSWRQEFVETDPDRNYKNLKDLKRWLKLWSYFPLVGHGQEDDKEGKIISVSEPSFFVAGIPLKDALEIAKHFKQYGIIYNGPEPEIGGDICLVKQNGTVEKRMQTFHPGKIADFYSSIRGRPFIFESIAVGWMEGYGRQEIGMTPILGIPRRQSWSGVIWETKN